MDPQSESYSSAEDLQVHSDAESSESPPELLIVVEQEHQENDEKQTENSVNHNQYVAAGGLQASKALTLAKTDTKTDSWEVIYDQMLSYHTDNTLPTGMDSSQTKQFRERADKYVVEDGVLYYKFSAKDKEVKLLKALRDEDERMEIIKKCHEDCNKPNLHNGRDKTIDSIRQNYYWKGIINDVKSYIKRCKSCEHRKPTPYQHYPPYVSLPDNCYKRPRLSSADTDYTILPAATTYNTASPSNSPLPADGKAVQFFLVKNDGSEPSSQEASPMRRHFAVTSSVERSPPQLYIVKTTTTMTNGDADPLVTSSVNNHNETVIHNGRSTQGVIRSFNPPSSKPHSGRTHKLTTDSLWEEIIEGCGVSRTFLSAPVVSAMQNGLNFKADPNQMRNSVDHYLTQILDLPEDYSAILCPSRAVAYVLSVASCMCSVDPMSIQTMNKLRSSRPLVVVHDASCCQDSTLPALASLVGGFCWFLGGPGTPMDRHMLSMAIASNRIAAVIHEPRLQQSKNPAMNLKYLSTLCHKSNVSVVVDNDEVSKDNIAATIREQVECNVDAAILPISTIGGPGEISMLIISHSLYRELCQNFETLQGLVAFPLTLPVHEILGALVTIRLCFQHIICE